MQKRLTKSNDKKILGVCAGIAEYLNVDPTIIRATYAVMSIACSCFPGVILYIALSVAMPKPDEVNVIEQHSSC